MLKVQNCIRKIFYKNIYLLANYISSKMENDDTINFTIVVERKNNENMQIYYNGKVDDFKTILKETDNFNELLKEKQKTF